LVAAEELRDFFSKNTDRFRVFHPEALYRRRGGAGGSTGPPHHVAARARGACHHMVSLPSGPLRLSFGPRPSFGKNRSFGFCFIQF
jgi:hypothetical protein